MLFLSIADRILMWGLRDLLFYKAINYTLAELYCGFRKPHGTEDITLLAILT